MLSTPGLCHVPRGLYTRTPHSTISPPRPTQQSLIRGEEGLPDSVEFEQGDGEQTRVVQLGPVKEFLRGHEARAKSMSMAIELSRPFVQLDPVVSWGGWWIRGGAQAGTRGCTLYRAVFVRYRIEIFE